MMRIEDKDNLNEFIQKVDVLVQLKADHYNVKKRKFFKSSFIRNFPKSHESIYKKEIHKAIYIAQPYTS